MGSLKRRPPGRIKQKPPFNRNELEIIDRVYHAAWAKILTRHPGHDIEKAEARQTALRKRLFILAARKPVEFDTLRDRVLVTMPETLMNPTRR